LLIKQKGGQDAHPTREDVIIEVILRFATRKGNLLVLMTVLLLQDFV
jgi:hypothetical protein